MEPNLMADQPVSNFLPEFNGNPISLLAPLADLPANKPAFSHPICYRTQQGAFYFSSKLASGDTVIQANVDIVARISETFGPAATSSYNIGPRQITWSVNQLSPSGPISIPVQMPVNFTGRFLEAEPATSFTFGGSTYTIPAGAGTGRNAHWKFYKTYNGGDFGNLIRTIYSTEATCRSIPRDPIGSDRGVYWYYLTNIDVTNTNIESRDSAFYWDTNGKEGQKWNDNNDTPLTNEADSNKNAAFPDGRYQLTINAQGYGDANDAASRKDTVSINNFNEFIYSCTSTGALKDTFCKGDPVYIRGVGFPKSKRFRVFVIKDRNWNEGDFIPGDATRVSAVSVMSDANGRIQPTLVWAAYAHNGSPDKGYDIVLDYNGDSLYSTPKLSKIVDPLDDSPLPFSIIGRELKVQKTKSDVKCYGTCDGKITITAVTNGTAPFTYVWSDKPAINKPNRDSLCAGKYWVTITDANGCKVTDTTVITQPAKLAATCSADSSYCGMCNGVARISASGGTAPYTYSWPGGTLSNLCPGTYTGIVTDANGCKDSCRVTVYAIPDLTISCSGTNSNFCSPCNGTATITASGGRAPYTYSWPGGMLTGLCAGTYTGTVTDAAGCTASCSVTIQQDSSTLTASCSGTNTNCGACDGTATITASGGRAPYTYSWPGGMLTGLCAGTYTGTVTDAAGCTASCSVTILQDSSTLTASCSGTNTNCGACDGTATITASGGRAPYTYSWPGGMLTGLCAGTYTGTVTDAAGCTASCSVTIQQDTATLSASCTFTNATACDTCDGTATITASGGTAPYTYNWPGGTLTGLCPGFYIGTVTDAMGCTASCTAYISANSIQRCDSIIKDTIAVRMGKAGLAKPVARQLHSIQAYPNPFDDVVNVRFYSTVADRAYITLQTATGIIVRQSSTPALKGYNTVKLDGKNLARGVYFIKIVIADSETVKVYRR